MSFQNDTNHKRVQKILEILDLARSYELAGYCREFASKHLFEGM